MLNSLPEYLGCLIMMIVNNKNEKNDRGKCLGLPLTSYYWVKLAIVSFSLICKFQPIHQGLEKFALSF